MRIVLSGETGAGKDYILNYLVNNYGFEKIVTTTTRPMRKGEIDGVTYNYVTDEEFKQKIENNEFLEYISYDTVYGKWFYGTDKKSVLKTNKDTVIILDAEGLIKYKEIVANSCTCIFIECKSEIQRLFNSLKRLDVDGKIETSALDELVRRVEEDKIKFAEIRKHIDIFLPQVYNETTLKIVDDIMLRAGKRRISK